MSTQLVPAGAQEATLMAVVTRADGTIEHLGVIGYWHNNPIKRLAWRLSKFLKG